MAASLILGISGITEGCRAEGGLSALILWTEERENDSMAFILNVTYTMAQAAGGVPAGRCPNTRHRRQCWQAGRAASVPVFLRLWTNQTTATGGGSVDQQKAQEVHDSASPKGKEIEEALRGLNSLVEKFDA